ncbi:MAG TPA: GntR family transcriptional regulator [Pseudonocardia sp.]|nr:GntR family transcriptional regulator [Pseudonocardia sp.]
MTKSLGRRGPPPRVRHRSMADQVADTLRRMILTRELAPGRRITQAELAEMLGVSTMPVREALLRLVAEGFVDTTANKSFSVTDTTRARLNDIYWIHGVLIGEMTARAWDNRDDELITVFKVAHSDFVNGLRRGSSEAMNAANLSVYAAIEDWSGSPGLAFMLGITLRFFPDFSDDVPGWSEIGSTWHTGLIDEFTGGTRQGAADTSVRSVRAATDLIVDSFWGFEA